MIPRNTTDPAGEWFDVLNEDGSPTGIRKQRAAVHRDGDWHRAFHLWLFARDESADDIVLLQRRAAGKDTWPNRLDVAVGGHFRAGETIADVIREVDEEIGIQTEIAQLTYAGRRRAVSFGPEWHDRELQEVYLLVFPGGFPAFAPNGTELAGLARIKISDLLRLFHGERNSVTGQVAPVVSDRKLGPWRADRITRPDLVPVDDDYWVRGALAGRALLNGGSFLPLDAR